MNPDFWSNKRKLTALGTGLLALDVIIDDRIEGSALIAAGGSCGNVMTILSFFGWQSYPMARLRDDIAAKVILADLRQWAVDTTFVRLDPKGTTPVIVERVSQTKLGKPRHKFEWTCPKCGSTFPKYRPLLDDCSAEIAKNMPKADIFFLDRVSKSSLTLAASAKEQGAKILFEPSGIGDRDLFIQCLKLTDIFKYSQERIKSCEGLTDVVKIPLEIQTLGANGLQYRTTRNGRKSVWRNLAAFPLTTLIDTAGSGDWLTASFLHYIWHVIGSTFDKISTSELRDALQFGQLAAGINCGFVGARGTMYSLEKRAFASLVTDELTPLRVEPTRWPFQTTMDNELKFCVGCP